MDAAADHSKQQFSEQSLVEGEVSADIWNILVSWMKLIPNLT